MAQRPTATFPTFALEKLAWLFLLPDWYPAPDNGFILSEIELARVCATLERAHSP